MSCLGSGSRHCCLGEYIIMIMIIIIIIRCAAYFLPTARSHFVIYFYSNNEGIAATA
jgi:hypothetical protein